MNGTCNYILDSMTRLGLTYADALKQAAAANGIVVEVAEILPSVSEIAEILKEREKDYQDAEIVVEVDSTRNIDVLVETVIDKLNHIITKEDN